MKIRYFTHSLLSCWNHGNAHFLRGVLRELAALGHDVLALEPQGNWSLSNLLSDHGEAGLSAFHAAYPELKTFSYGPDSEPEALIDGAEVVIVHEWNDPTLVAALGSLRARGATFTLLFHDTHHRAVSDPQAIRAFDLSAYDGVLAFGETLSEVYRRWGWGDRVWTWHEAADLKHFRPPQVEKDRQGVVWIGNWGDGERTAELEDFLFRPASQANLPLDIYGVRYPDEALATLKRYGVDYHGWAANARAPAIFAQHLATVHVPRRYYTQLLPGIPTIRVFEALACGIPLLSAPWEDSEHLFRSEQDFLFASDGKEMADHLRAVASDPDLRASLIRSGLETIRSRHSCAHRAEQLVGIIASLNASATPISLARNVA
ncbi:CgeB family protein [Novosphingobium sp. Chol11]|uniref:CgeB family protein n=1 Tax=Novosphingobium sp. Chol11 TaxID=1385763 RepID=UPI000BE41E1C|nr:glycosyltransferase [Novosphingobium sp. Chol11]